MAKTFSGLTDRASLNSNKESLSELPPEVQSEIKDIMIQNQNVF